MKTRTGCRLDRLEAHYRQDFLTLTLNDGSVKQILSGGNRLIDLMEDIARDVRDGHPYRRPEAQWIRDTVRWHDSAGGRLIELIQALLHGPIKRKVRSDGEATQTA